MFASPNFAKAILELPEDNYNYNVIDQLEEDKKNLNKKSRNNNKEHLSLLNRLSNRLNPSLVSCSGSNNEGGKRSKQNAAKAKRPKSQILSNKHLSEQKRKLSGGQTVRNQRISTFGNNSSGSGQSLQQKNPLFNTLQVMTTQ